MYTTFTLCHSYVFLYYVMPAYLSYLFYVLVVPVHVILVLSSLVFCFSVYICLVPCMQKSLSVFFKMKFYEPVNITGTKLRLEKVWHKLKNH